MKAIVCNTFGEESVLGLREVREPDIGESDVLVRLAYAGVNPVDAYIRSGSYALLPQLPYTPGDDGAGVVIAVGEKASFQIGDEVFVAANQAKHNTGTYAQLVAVDETAVALLPKGISMAQGAALGVPGYASSLALFTKAKIQPGETILIHGASGGMGTLAIQQASLSGCKVYGTAGSQEGLQLLKSLGAFGVYNHKSPDYLMDMKRDSGGFDVIIESLANINLNHDLDLLKKNGRLVIVGSRGKLDFDPRAVMAKDAVIYGLAVQNSTLRERQEVLQRLTYQLYQGLKPVVSQEFALADAPLAHREVLNKKTSYGKLVLKISMQD
ncbi:MAG: NADPH:quinone reductase [Erysipelotrichaceae bacterium]|jgi:NADPH2:quinone reductase|nr:NADPH:quinone reductase [Erysipelotrichaceae bacterium]